MKIGTTVAQKYRLGPEIGRGGMGSVYEATHTSTGRRVALKIMRAGLDSGLEESERIARFEREAVVVGQLETQHIVQVFDAGADPESKQLFIAMELLVGEDVSKLLKRLGPLPVELAVAMIAQACTGLAKAHEAGIVHRDIKPGNLFLSRTEYGDLVVKILDFGVAKVRRGADDVNAESATLTQTGMLVGSPHYMSPEQARGKKSIDHRADVWSLGIVLHKLIAARTPWDGTSSLGDVIVAICSAEPTPLDQHAPWAPPLVVDVIRRALRRKPSERLGSALEMLEALKPLLPNGPRITEDMLVGLPEELRAQLAALPAAGDSNSFSAVEDNALTSPVTPPGSAAFPATVVVVPVNVPPPHDSHGGIASTSVERTPRRGLVAPMLAAALLLAVAGAALGIAAHRRTPAAAAALAASEPAAAPAVSSAPAPLASLATTATSMPTTSVASRPSASSAPSQPAAASTPASGKGKSTSPIAAPHASHPAASAGRLSGGVGADVPF